MSKFALFWKKLSRFALFREKRQIITFLDENFPLLIFFQYGESRTFRDGRFGIGNLGYRLGTATIILG